MKCTGCKKGNENLLLSSVSCNFGLADCDSKQTHYAYSKSTLHAYSHRVMHIGLSTLHVLETGAASRTQPHIRGRTAVQAKERRYM